MASVQPAGRRGKRLMGEINVVPYIDVMLVLLIIFMITAPLLTEGVKVQLPKAGAKPIPPELMKDAKPIVLTINEKGQLFLNYNKPEDEPLPAAKVEAQAAAVQQAMADGVYSPVMDLVAAPFRATRISPS